MKKVFVVAALACFVFLGVVCKKSDITFNEDHFDPRLSGGMATTFSMGSGAFGEMIKGMSSYDQLIHSIGDALFEQTFVSAPAPQFPGLGPLFNNVSCISCHHNDGKGTATAGFATSSLLTRISIPGTNAHGGPVAAPWFGTQLQDKAINGWQPEVKLDISYEEQTFTYPDGSTAQLRKPNYQLTNAHQPLPAQYQISVRLAPPVFGLGLLDLIPESTLLAQADETDANGDGISGKANYIYNPINLKHVMGRYGLKANNTLLLQIAGAFNEDMGITNPVFPNENYSTSPSYPTDIDDSMLNAVVFYLRTLAVPARRNVEDPQVQLGEKIFAQINCTSCHTPTFQTGVDVRLPMLSNQRIHPYTDLLLHDMGAGLADNRPDYLASGSEWKTPALWGIGLFPKTNGIPFYLHDGRARSIEEAILWHGGEAEKSKQKFTQLNTAERKALLKFIESL